MCGSVLLSTRPVPPDHAHHVRRISAIRFLPSHPFYLAFALGIVGGSLVAANWFFLLAGLVPFCFLVARTRIEEEKLIERFGDEYRNYMRRVGRFLPKIL